MPSGHPEGYLEGFATIYREAADAIIAKREGKAAAGEVIYPGMEDGLAGLAFIDAAVRSSQTSAWINIDI